MEICNEHEEAIVYDSKVCPLCRAYDEINDLESNVQDLESENESLQEQLSDANETNDVLKDKIEELKNK